jgi:hypothetical protein
MSGFKVTIAVLILSLPLAGFGTAAVPDDQNDLLKARELVWRACFAIGCHSQGASFSSSSSSSNLATQSDGVPEYWSAALCPNCTRVAGWRCFQGTFQQPPVPGLKPWAVICSHFAAKSDVPVRDAIPSIQDHFEFAVASE